MTRTLTLMLLLAMLPGITSAEDKPLEKKDLENMLIELQAMRKGLYARNKRFHATALKAFTEAGKTPVSAGQLFMKCEKEVKYGDARTSKWRAYRDRNEEKWASLHFKRAQQLRLQYLVLTIKAGQTEDRSSLVPALIKGFRAVPVRGCAG